MTHSPQKPSLKKLRPPQRDAQATQEKILEAAEREFSRHGLKGARIGEIAQNSGVTTAMIYYYFQSKEGLYKAVLERPALEVQEIMSGLNLDQKPPIEALKAFIEAAIAYEAKHPHRGMLWFQEANQNGGEYFKLNKGSWSGIFAYINAILERGMADGSFRQLDPLVTIVQILGICIFYFNIHENWKHFMPDYDRLSPEAVNKHTQEAIDLILNGVKASKI
ncbi:transcriptional regulator, TetR family [Gloeothece citriformis PCC 7424]|uniref:Transcriptional regulator, TetR family n=1 Tax=Gloeothece citriformis (strain PCC 7424) TaxID=65393 RepID=B7K935_GLOC7|nr:TetR/AcrR family transcriptional regulator [Gloeothece citriformis]ACK72804.1 transcriptional regulator, TetR family [Gloeothece citriformis PCC 7424]